MRDNSYLQAEGIQKDFEIAYSPDQNNSQPSSSVTFVKSAQLPDVQGRIDHISIDKEGKRLFIAELGNNSVDVIDLASGSRLHTIIGLSEPQGVLFIPKLNKIFISNGDDGTVGIYNGSSYTLITSTKLGSDADNIRYDNSTGLVYVGYGVGALAVLDSDGSHIADISLPGHPESFQIEESGSRIFVNVPSDHSIVLVDKQAHSVLRKWQASNDAFQNFPMALDANARHVLVAFRDPAKLGVFSMDEGTVIASPDICGDADDLFVDAKRRRVYISCGEGFLDVLDSAQGAYRRIARIATVAGARTSLFVPEMDRLMLAVRASAGEPAAIWVFQPMP